MSVGAFRTSTLLAALDRFNAEHPWSHNDAFAHFVLGHARAVRRRGGAIAVDVGCGTGNLIERLARVLPDVTGIEPDPDMAAAATRRFRDSGGIRIVQRPFAEEADRECDLLVFVASLHHLPLAASLRQARSMLRPGGRLVVVGLAEEAGGADARSLASLVLNPVIGVVRHPRRAAARPAAMTAPTARAVATFSEIRRVASDVLPGIRMRRRLFWRYTAVWVAPR